MGKGGMIYYHVSPLNSNLYLELIACLQQTWTWFWWLRVSGSPIGKPMAWVPSLICCAITFALQASIPETFSTPTTKDSIKVHRDISHSSPTSVSENRSRLFIEHPPPIRPSDFRHYCIFPPHLSIPTGLPTVLGREDQPANGESRPCLSCSSLPWI